MKVGIVGAGIVGRLLAWHLCQANHEVHLFTKGCIDSIDACSTIAAGMISPYAELPVMSLPWHKLGLTALKWWPAIIESLPCEVHYQTKGTLVVCLPSQKALLQHFINHIQHKLPGFFISLLSEQEISALEPEISRHVGCHLPEAYLSPNKLFKAFNAFFARKSVIWHPYHDVKTITASTVMCEQMIYSFDKTVDCRGMGAQAVLPMLRGVRGEIIQCYAPEVQLQHAIRFLHPRFPCYIVPQGNQQFAIGATQIESESLQGVTFRSAIDLMSQAVNVHAGFAQANILAFNVGCRPTTIDHMPLVQECDGVTFINGMSRHGFMLAPQLTADIVARWKKAS